MKKTLLALPLLLSACAPAPVTPTTDANGLLRDVCSIGSDIREARGSAWIHARSKQASGQFPAMVLAQAPETLKLEVTNLIGAREATITVTGEKYTIQSQNPKMRSSSGVGTWGGIPLRWAPALFLGRIPCPAHADHGRVSVGSDGTLAFIQPASLARDEERFTYHFRSWEGKAWPESLDWDLRGTLVLHVHFDFDQPEEHTGSPLKWQATSTQGEVKMRWRDRQLAR